MEKSSAEALSAKNAGDIFVNFRSASSGNQPAGDSGFR